MTEESELETEPSAPTVDIKVADKVAETILDKDKWWQPGSTVDLGEGKRWSPTLMSADKNRLLHVHIAHAIPRFVERRLRLAVEAGYTLYVALPLEALYDAELIALMADLDAMTYVITDAEVSSARHYLAALADIGVPVEPALRRAVARAAWQRMGLGSNYERGRRLEAVLAFLLSQVADFQIFSRNYRNETQEIDIVVRVDNFSARCWFVPGVPFILVEAKNQAEPAGQPVVSLLIRKLQTKRGKAKLGLLFSVTGVSSDARSEELRLSESDLCVAMFGPDEISAWIEADDLDAHLEQVIAQAMLR